MFMASGERRPNRIEAETSWPLHCALVRLNEDKTLSERPSIGVLAECRGRFEMSTFSDSYVLNVLLGQRPNGQGVAARRSRWLRRSLFDRYRHELHYPRGAGPKWHEKYACRVGRELGFGKPTIPGHRPVTIRP
jgi:hypothetical protein